MKLWAHLPLGLLVAILSFLLSTSQTFFALASQPQEDNQAETVVRDFFDRNAPQGGIATSDSLAESESVHTNNWAVLVCASRYWFNYRHMANALGMYRTVKRLGIPDSQIILMLADDVACNARNRYPGCVFADQGRKLDLYGENIEVDYRGYEVTVENFLRVLTGRVDPSVPRSKRLLTDDRSNIFVYMTGHGGNEFLKFQDNEEISAFDIADAFEQMWAKKRYNEIFFMIDTCQANTMFSKFYSPNILATGSSEIHENSYSYENDNDVGVAVIDSFTHFVLSFMEKINKTSTTSMQDLFDTYDPVKIRSNAGVRSDLFHRPLSKTLITDFFGGVAHAEVLIPSLPAVSSSSSHPGVDSEGLVMVDRQQQTASVAEVDTSATETAISDAELGLGAIPPPVICPNVSNASPVEESRYLLVDETLHFVWRDTKVVGKDFGALRAWVGLGALAGLVGWVVMKQ